MKFSSATVALESQSLCPQGLPSSDLSHVCFQRPEHLVKKRVILKGLIFKVRCGYVCMYVSMCPSADAHGGQGVGSSGAGVPDTCDLTNVGAGAHIQLLQKQCVPSTC